VRGAQNPVLLEQVLNNRLLLPIDPPSEKENNETERSGQRVHGASVPERLGPVQDAPDSRSCATKLDRLLGPQTPIASSTPIVE